METEIIKQNHQMVITLGERKKRQDWRGMSRRKEKNGKKAESERRKKDKEVLMAFCFIIYGSPGWMLSEAEILLHKSKTSGRQTKGGGWGKLGFFPLQLLAMRPHTTAKSDRVHGI
jgi:hypothetical protein